MPALPEVSIPRFTGKAQYASRVWFPDLLYVKFLTCPHPHARIKNIDTSAAEKMPGVAYILTYKNAPKPTRSERRRDCGHARSAAAGTESARRSGGHRCGGDGRSGRGCGRRDQGGVRSAALRIDAQGHHGARMRPICAEAKGNLLRHAEFARQVPATPPGRTSRATSKKDSPKRT